MTKGEIGYGKPVLDHYLKNITEDQQVLIRKNRSIKSHIRITGFGFYYIWYVLCLLPTIPK
jgi:hypothetical protein